MNMVNNSVHLIGHLGQDPEIKTFKNGGSLAKVSLATRASYKNENGKLEFKAHWHRLVAWNRQAEIMEKYLKKGSKIAVVGSLEYNEYEDKKGVKRSIAQIIVYSFEMLDKKK